MSPEDDSRSPGARGIGGCELCLLGTEVSPLKEQ